MDPERISQDVNNSLGGRPSRRGWTEKPPDHGSLVDQGSRVVRGKRGRSTSGKDEAEEEEVRNSKRLSRGGRRKRRNLAHDDAMEDGNEESEASNEADVARQRSEDVEEDGSPSAERREAPSQRGNARSGRQRWWPCT